MVLTEEQERVLQEKGYFLYQGFHFKPVGKFPKQENDFFKIVRRLRSDDELGMKSAYYGTGKRPYSHKEFYEASPVKDADIFLCLENQKEYVPCEHELQQYMREPDRRHDRGKAR